MEQSHQINMSSMEQSPTMGYPVEVLVQQPFQNPTVNSSRNPPQPPAKETTCLECAIMNSINIFLLCAIILVATAPEHSEIINFELDSVTVHPFNISNSSDTITANWNLVFSDAGYVYCKLSCREIFNPHIRDIEVSILYKNEVISSVTTNSPLVQCNRDHDYKRHTHAEIDASSVHINGSTADAILADLTSHGALNITVKAIVDIEGLARLTASCENVNVGFSSNKMTGIMFGGSRTCNSSFY